MRRAAACIGLLLIACVTDSDLRRHYHRTDPTPRVAKATEDVEILDKQPSGRSFQVIGRFTPPDNLFGSYKAAVKGAQRVGALYGADAVIITTRVEAPQILQPRHFEPYEAPVVIHVEAKTIVFAYP